MTDKQIIIYKKECYNEPHCSLNQALEQLKAKEQECEAYKMEADEGKEINAELKAENDELKKQFKLAEPLYQVCNIKDKKINKLKQTLTEIKEIIEQGIKIHDDIIVSKQILQKISEVENG